VDHILDIDPTIWNASRSIFLEMVVDRFDDPRTTSRRCIQFRFVFGSSITAGSRVANSSILVVDLGVYPSTAFNFALAVGLLVLRWRRKRVGLPPSDFRAWTIAVAFSIAANLYLLIMPWYPPSTGKFGGDVSFWYATYCVVGIGM
jgi:hypothetical protein